MIIPTDTFFAVNKDFGVTELATRLPDDVLQPSRAQRIATQLEILVSNHIEQDHCSRIREFVALF